jgi:transcriptional regulator with GAF, ATPase, and Fis domain
VAGCSRSPSRGGRPRDGPEGQVGSQPVSASDRFCRALPYFAGRRVASTFHAWFAGEQFLIVWRGVHYCGGSAATMRGADTRDCLADTNAIHLELGPRLLARLGQTETDAATQIAGALADVLELVEADYVAVIRCQSGGWHVRAGSGRDASPPWELLSESLDREAPVARGAWRVAPLWTRSADAELLAVHGAQQRLDETALCNVAALLAALLQVLRVRRRADQRVQRMQAILDIAAQWQMTLEMDQLLEQMAEASTRLLDCERASIFLWDRPNHMLIARPALGVEGGELRIADNTGVVGQVVQTGESRRVNAGEDQRAIDRGVDKQLKFHTESLLCVPLRAASGELFGAFEMINKRGGRFDDEDEAALVELAAHAALALENTQQYGQLLRTRNQMADQAAAGVQLIGQHASMSALQSTIRRVADTELAVLILGENGTGKEVVSQMIHYLSRRRNEPFIAVNCAAITETLLESELFGHERGAFTDARERRAGKFELASGGTLFLDEIGEMSLAGQAKLLRVLEEKIVVRVGGSTPIHTNARVIAATNQDLTGLVQAKKFREDLYYRLNVVTLELPPLRERGEDVLLLAEHFLGDFAARARRKPPRLTAAARKRLLSHPWPGNVRELRNLIERLVYLASGETIDANDLSFILSPKREADWFTLDLPLTEATRDFQIEYIRRHISAAGGNMTEAARRLGLHRSNLYRKMWQLGMEVKEDENEN